MCVTSLADIRALRRVGRLVAEIVAALFAVARPGMTTRELDELGRRMLEEAGATSAPRALYGFPGWVMVSINEEVAHAVPSDRRIEEGDLVNIDVSAELGGYYADTGSSAVVTAGGAQEDELCFAGREALTAALGVVRAGRRIAEVARVVREVAVRRGFTVLENLSGHGVGLHLHEEPTSVPKYWDMQDRRRFAAGTVLTIEPFLSTGARQAEVGPDQWTLVTPAGIRSVQYEHTLVVTNREPLLLTAL